MNKKIKVYLQYPWKFPDSPYYKYLLTEHLDEIEYKNINKQKGVITSRKFFWMSNFLKRRIRGLLRSFAPAALNIHKSPEGNYDLIHCAHCLSKNKKSWVVDIEAFWQLWASTKITKKGIERARKVLEKNNCK